MHQDLSTSSESMLWTQILEHHSWNNPPELMDRRSAWEAAGKEHWWFGLRRSSRMGWMVAWHGPGIWPRRLELSLVIARTSWSGCVKKHADKGKTAHKQTDDQIWQLFSNWFPATKRTKNSLLIWNPGDTTLTKPIWLLPAGSCWTLN